MSIGDTRTVWILGAGFSKSLGGPLLPDLFHQQNYEDLTRVIGHDRAAQVAWAQGLYHFGRHGRLWADAEEFLAYVEAACGDPAHPAKNNFLQGLIERSDFYGACGADLVGHADEIFVECARSPLNPVLHAFGTETSQFLRHNPVAGEQWRPYVEWMNLLTPDRDCVITFNYDTVLEKLEAVFRDRGLGRLQIVLPGETVRRDRVPVYKLHGSVNWVQNEDTGYVEVCDNAVEQNKKILIAAPGRSKASLTSKVLKPLWTHAREALKVAGSVAVVGYSFPKTDAQARMEILEALHSDNSGVRSRRVHLVLGPDLNLPGHRRVLELMRPRLGIDREKYVDELPAKVAAAPNTGPRTALVVRHPLYAEDFIGDYVVRTT